MPPKRDVVTLTNLPAMVPQDPRQKMLNQHRLPREMLEFEDAEETFERLDGQDQGLPMVLGSVVLRDTKFGVRQPIPIRQTSFPKAEHRSKKPGFGLGTTSRPQPSKPIPSNEMVVDGAPDPYTSTLPVEEPTEVRGLDDLNMQDPSPAGTQKTVEALLLAMRSQMTSQRIFAAKMLTKMCGDERAKSSRQGALEYILCGPNQTANVTTIRMALDDNNHQMCTHVLQLLHTILQSTNEQGWISNMQWHTSSEGSPCRQLLSLHHCTDLMHAEGEYKLHGKDIKSEDELKTNIQSNLCIALLGMNILPRLRYIMEIHPAQPQHRELGLDIMTSLCTRTCLAGKAIATCPHMVPLLKSFIKNPSALTEDDPLALRVFTKTLRLMNAIGLCNRESCVLVMSTAVLDSTMQVLGIVAGTERLGSDVWLMALAKEILRLWFHLASYRIPDIQAYIADSFTFLSQLLNAPLSCVDVASASHIPNLFAIGQWVLLLTFQYLQAFPTTDSNFGIDFRAWVEADIPVLIEACVARVESSGLQGQDANASTLSTVCMSLIASAVETLSGLFLSKSLSLNEEQKLANLLTRLQSFLFDKSSKMVPQRGLLFDETMAYALPYMQTWSAEGESTFATTNAFTLDCPPNLAWLPPFTESDMRNCARTSLLLAILRLQHRAFHFGSATAAVVKSATWLGEIVVEVLQKFNSIDHRAFIKDPLDAAQPFQVIASKRFRQFVASGEGACVHMCMLLYGMLDATQDPALLRRSGLSLSVYLPPNSCKLYHKILDIAFQPSYPSLLSYFQQIVELPSETADMYTTFYYGHQALLEGASKNGDPGCHLDHFWLFRPVLQPNDKKSKKVHGPETLQVLYREWLDFMIEVESDGHVFLKSMAPTVKLICLTNVFSLGGDVAFLPEIKGRVQQLMTLYVQHQLQGTHTQLQDPEATYPVQTNNQKGNKEDQNILKATNMQTEKIARMKPHLDRLLEIYLASAYAEPICSQMLMVLLHPSFPPDFQNTILEQMSTSRLVFVQLGQAFMHGADELLHHLLHGYFHPNINNFGRINKLAEFLVILPNQMKGNAEDIERKLHSNLLYWMFIHHVASWVWAIPGDVMGDYVISQAQSTVLLTVLRETNLFLVCSDILRYEPLDGPIVSLDLLKEQTRAMPKWREATILQLLKCEPELRPRFSSASAINGSALEEP